MYSHCLIPAPPVLASGHLRVDQQALTRTCACPHVWVITSTAGARAPYVCGTPCRPGCSLSSLTLGPFKPPTLMCFFSSLTVYCTANCTANVSCSWCCGVPPFAPRARNAPQAVAGPLPCLSQYRHRYLFNLDSFQRICLCCEVLKAVVFPASAGSTCVFCSAKGIRRCIRQRN